MNSPSDDSSQGGSSGKGSSRAREWLYWAFFLGLIAAGLLRWLGQGDGGLGTLNVPWRPPEVAASLARAEALPGAAGELEGWNALLVTLDTLRPDRLGCYGNRDIETPHLDALAEQGVIFVDALATAPTTLPSHASILTGLYPHRHGARANGLFPMGDAPLTLAEILAARGYATAAFVSSFILDARFGLAQGFGVYDDAVESKAAESESPDEGPWLREATRRFRDPERRGDHTTDRAIAWLREEREAPFFLWVHFYDPHAAYEPPPPYAGRYADNPYDGEIAFTDAQVGRLLAALDATGAAEQTLVVVVADHGESLGDHGEPTHSFLLHEATLRIPLLMRAGSRWEGVRVDRPVSQVDLAPTILSLLGAPAPADLDGRDLTRAPSQPRPLLAETIQGLVEYGWAPLASVQQGARKYIHGPRPELYDLATDPLEARNLFDARGDEAAVLRARLEAAHGPDLDAALSPKPAGPLDPATAARLEALGYAVSGSTPPPAGPRADPKQMLPVLTRVQELVFGEAALRGPDAVVGELEAIAREHPDFVPTFRYLAELRRESGDLAGAELATRRALELAPDAAPQVNTLAEILLARGRLEEATATWEEMLARQPNYFEGRYNLGVILLSTGAPGRAADHLLRAFEIDPDEPIVIDPLVQAMAATGRSAELETALAAALAEDPGRGHVRDALGALRAAPRRRGTGVDRS